MVFNFYHRLSQRNKQVYRLSDRIDAMELPHPERLRAAVAQLPVVLRQRDPRAVRPVCAQITDGITKQLEAPPVRVQVLATRPSSDWGELHGLYEPVEERKSARITVWMRTAKRRQTVAFRTFLRTLLHEMCHHLDYEHFHFCESFHTEGFYKRESSLYYQLTATAPEQQKLNF